ncbi:MAG TPA: hypothetical protein VIA62_25480 [Thermoanaerobaculia bacterium]|jgi:hypothetical protein|nr:hypothetical protein [Thermoanaerobaculia bacterium]
MGNGGTGKQYYPPVDPGGLQTASTGATALGFVALVGSGTGTTVAKALGLGAHVPQVLSAGISMASLGSLSLFSAGLMLVGLGIVLNIASLVLRRQYSYEGSAYSQRDSGHTNTEKPDTTERPPTDPTGRRY